MSIPRLQDLDVRDKRVLMRVDFNVPLNRAWEITDDTRLREALPSIRYILDHGGSVILMSHLGRPRGTPTPEFSLQVCAKRLSTLLDHPVLFPGTTIGKSTEDLCNSLKPGQVVLLENLRFYPGEEDPQQDPKFAQELAKLGDLYVNDAFGTAHRYHASTAAIAAYFPGKKAAGLLMQKEIQALSSLLSSPGRPFYVIIGGAKISSKLGVLKSLLSKVDGIFIGGGMAYTFLAAQGKEIGSSICELDLKKQALDFLTECRQHDVKVFLPFDIVIADHFSNDSNKRVISINDGIPEGWQGMDLGPRSLEIWVKEIQQAATIFWNGPVGVFEFSNFAKGTNMLAKTIAQLSVTTIVGGGDSVSAINQLGLADRFTHVSTGGGASLEYLEFGQLPGIEALK